MNSVSLFGCAFQESFVSIRKFSRSDRFGSRASIDSPVSLKIFFWRKNIYLILEA